MFLQNLRRFVSQSKLRQNLPLFVQFRRGKAAPRTLDREPDVRERTRFQAGMGADVEPPAEPAELKTVAEPAVPPPEHPVRRLFTDVTGSEQAAHDPMNTTFGSPSKPRSPCWSHEASSPRSIEIQYRDSRYESGAVRRHIDLYRGTSPRVLPKGQHFTVNMECATTSKFYIHAGSFHYDGVTVPRSGESHHRNPHIRVVQGTPWNMPASPSPRRDSRFGSFSPPPTPHTASRSRYEPLGPQLRRRGKIDFRNTDGGLTPSGQIYSSYRGPTRPASAASHSPRMGPRTEYAKLRVRPSTAPPMRIKGESTPDDLWCHQMDTWGGTHEAKTIAKSGITLPWSHPRSAPLLRP